MTFSLLVLSKQIPNGERIFNLAALVVFVSILAHGLTDTPGANWIARRAEARERGSPPPEGEPSPAPAS
jgi:NhaP-type Na+/H+ and K+/H+ antiporter